MNEKMSENMRIGEWLDTWFEVYEWNNAVKLFCNISQNDGRKL